MADINYTIGVNADVSSAQNSLKSLQAQLQSISSSPIDINNASLVQANKLATELQQHINGAINKTTGNLDLSVFSRSLKESGTSLQSYRQSLEALGPAGRQTFLSLSNAIAQAEAPVNRLNDRILKFGKTLKNTISWQLSSSLVHGLVGQFQTAINYAERLNKSLNNIQIVTGHTNDQLVQFAKQANEAARRLNTTTTEYTNASLIYYQQGLNDKEVAARVETTLKLANVTRQSAQIVSDQMTAIWNNFSDGTDNLERYADVITALGAATASSSTEIAKGLERFAAVADTIGLSYENATAALATIVATTRNSADSVGTGLRTLFSRLQSLKLGETLEDGVGLSKYSAALESVGVNVLDAVGNLRNMDDILDDLGAKWSTISKAQQVALAQTVGGVRQYTNLIALMDNYDFYKENLKIAQESEGTLQTQAARYAQSWEAARDKVQASAEGIYDSLIDDQKMIKLTNVFSGFLDIINGIVSAFGGLGGIVTAVSAVMLNSFAKEMPTVLRDLGANFRVFTNSAAKDMNKLQDENTRQLYLMRDTATSDAERAQIEKTLQLNQMNQSLTKKQSRMSQADQEKYRTQMMMAGLSYDNQIKAAQEVDRASESFNQATLNSFTKTLSANGKSARVRQIEQEAKEQMAQLRLETEQKKIEANYKEQQLKAQQIQSRAQYSVDKAEKKAKANALLEQQDKKIADAELKLQKELENSSQQYEKLSGPTQNLGRAQEKLSKLEAQKADIEQRRQDELIKGTTIARGSATSAYNKLQTAKANGATKEEIAKLEQSLIDSEKSVKNVQQRINDKYDQELRYAGKKDNKNYHTSNLDEQIKLQKQKVNELEQQRKEQKEIRDQKAKEEADKAINDAKLNKARINKAKASVTQAETDKYNEEQANYRKQLNDISKEQVAIRQEQVNKEQTINGQKEQLIKEETNKQTEALKALAKEAGYDESEIKKIKNPQELYEKSTTGNLSFQESQLLKQQTLGLSKPLKDVSSQIGMLQEGKKSADQFMKSFTSNLKEGMSPEDLQKQAKEFKQNFTEAFKDTEIDGMDSILDSLLGLDNLDKDKLEEQITNIAKNFNEKFGEVLETDEEGNISGALAEKFSNLVDLAKQAGILSDNEAGAELLEEGQQLGINQYQQRIAQIRSSQQQQDATATQGMSVALTQAATSIMMLNSAFQSATNAVAVFGDETSNGLQKFGAAVGVITSSLMSAGMVGNSLKGFADDNGMLKLGKLSMSTGAAGLIITAATTLLGTFIGKMQQDAAKATETMQTEVANAQEANQTINNNLAIAKSFDVAAQQYRNLSNAVEEGSASISELIDAQKELYESSKEIASAYQKDSITYKIAAGDVEGALEIIDEAQIKELQKNRTTLETGLKSAGNLLIDFPTMTRWFSSKNYSNAGINDGEYGLNLDFGITRSLEKVEQDTEEFFKNYLSSDFITDYEGMIINPSVFNNLDNLLAFYDQLKEAYDALSQEEDLAVNENEYYTSAQKFLSYFAADVENYRQLQNDYKQQTIQLMALGESVTYNGESYKIEGIKARDITDVFELQTLINEIKSNIMKAFSIEEGTDEYDQMMSQINKSMEQFGNIINQDGENLVYLNDALNGLVETQTKKFSKETSKFDEQALKEEFLKLYKEYGDAIFQAGLIVPLIFDEDQMTKSAEDAIKYLQSLSKYNQLTLEIEFAEKVDLDKLNKGEKGVKSKYADWKAFEDEIDKDLWKEIFSSDFNLEKFQHLTIEQQEILWEKYLFALEKNQIQAAKDEESALNGVIENLDEQIEQDKNDINNLVNQLKAAEGKIETSQSETEEEQQEDEEEKNAAGDEEEPPPDNPEIAAAEAAAGSLDGLANAAKLAAEALAELRQQQQEEERNQSALDWIEEHGLSEEYAYAKTRGYTPEDFQRQQLAIQKEQQLKEMAEEKAKAEASEQERAEQRAKQLAQEEAKRIALAEAAKEISSDQYLEAQNNLNLREQIKATGQYTDEDIDNLLEGKNPLTLEKILNLAQMAEDAAKRTAAQEEAKRIAAEEEAKRIAAEEEAKRIAAEKEAQQAAATEELWQAVDKEFKSGAITYTSPAISSTPIGMTPKDWGFPAATTSIEDKQKAEQEALALEIQQTEAQAKLDAAYADQYKARMDAVQTASEVAIERKQAEQEALALETQQTEAQAKLDAAYADQYEARMSAVQTASQVAVDKQKAEQEALALETQQTEAQAKLDAAYADQYEARMSAVQTASEIAIEKLQIEQEALALETQQTEAQAKLDAAYADQYEARMSAVQTANEIAASNKSNIPEITSDQLQAIEEFANQLDTDLDTAYLYLKEANFEWSLAEGRFLQNYKEITSAQDELIDNTEEVNNEVKAENEIVEKASGILAIIAGAGLLAGGGAGLTVGSVGAMMSPTLIMNGAPGQKGPWDQVYYKTGGPITYTPTHYANKYKDYTKASNTGEIEYLANEDLLTNRPILDSMSLYNKYLNNKDYKELFGSKPNEGDISTLLTRSQSNAAGNRHVILTPILQNGKILDDATVRLIADQALNGVAADERHEFYDQVVLAITNGTLSYAETLDREYIHGIQSDLVKAYEDEQYIENIINNKDSLREFITKAYEQDFTGLSGEEALSKLAPIYQEAFGLESNDYGDSLGNFSLSNLLNSYTNSIEQGSNYFENLLAIIDEVEGLLKDEESKASAEGASETAKQQQEAAKWLQQSQLEATAQRLGINIDDLREYATYLQDIAETSLEFNDALQLAFETMQRNSAIDTLNSSYSKLLETLRSTTASAEDQSKALKNLKQGLADILNIDIDKLQTKALDWAKTGNNLEKLVKGNKEAFGKLLAKQVEGTFDEYGKKLTKEQEKAIDKATQAAAKRKTGEKVSKDRDDLFNSLFGDWSDEEILKNVDMINDVIKTATDTMEDYIIPTDKVQQTKSAMDSMGEAAQGAAESAAEAGAAGTQAVTDIADAAAANADNTINVDLEAEEPVTDVIPVHEEVDATSTIEAHGEGILAGTGDGAVNVSGSLITDGNVGYVKSPEGTAKGTNSGSGNKGGGGGGGGHKKKDKKKPDTSKRYHTIREHKADNERAKAAVEREKDRAFGAEKIAQSEKEIELQKEAIDLQRQYVEEINSYIVGDKNNMVTSLSKLGITIQFDKDGVIENYREIEAALLAQENELIDKYNNESIDDEAYEEAQKKIDEAREYIAIYEETLNLYEEQMDQLAQYLNELADMALELTKLKVELKIDIDEDALKLLEYRLSKIEDDAYKTAEAISLIGDKTGITLDKINNWTNGLIDLFSQKGLDINDIANWTDQQIIEAGFTQNEMDWVRELRDNLLDASEEINAFRKEVIEKLSSDFDTLYEKVQRQYDQFEHYNTVLDTYKNITDLMGRTMNKEQRELIDQLNKGILDNQKKQLQSAKLIYENLLTDREAVLEHYNEAVQANDEDAMHQWEVMLDNLDEKVNEAHENYLDSWNTTMEQAKTIFEYAIEGIIEQFNQAMSGMFGNLNYLSDAFERAQQTDEQYLQDYDRLYHLSKLQRDLSKTLGDTKGLENRKALLTLQKEITQLQESGVKLSQYDVDALTKRYELLQAYNDLLDAQDAKHVVRLHRDNAGNWGYVYTVDEDAVAEAEQKYEDKLHEYQQLNDNYIKELQSRVLQTQQTYRDTLQEIMTDTTLTDEERQARVNELNRWLQEEMSFFEQQLNNAMENQHNTLDRYYNAYQDTRATLVDSWHETTLSLLTNVESLDDYMNNWKISTEELLTSSYNALQELINNMNEINQEAEVESEDIATAIATALATIGEASELTGEQLSSLVDEVNEEFLLALQTAIEQEEKWVQQTLAASEANEQLAESLNNLIIRLTELGSFDVALVNARAKYQAAQTSWRQGKISEAEWHKAEAEWKEFLDEWMAQFDEGGYTGTWGSGGKMAILHERENVFNKDDTENLLDAAKILRVIDLQSNNMIGGIGNLTAPNIQGFSQILEQQVTITAEFPNATDRYEIEEAFNNLANKATQYANEKRNG